MTGYELELELHERTDAEWSAIARKNAAACPRCPSCGHHLNAHDSGSCGVVQERTGGKAKCGCTAIRRKAA